MRILLANTGRGGEQAVFTAIIRAYRNACPDDYIRILTPHNTVYSHIFKNSPDHNQWEELRFRNSNGVVVMDPVVAMKKYFADTKNDFDIQEYVCEYDLSPAFGKQPIRTIIENCYKRIKTKKFRLQDIPRQIFIYPDDDELRFADDLFQKHGNDLILVSYKANSASPIMNPAGYQQLCNHLGKHRSVAYTGNVEHEEMKGHIDLRGITFSTVFAIAQKLQSFVGPDTAITWLVANMPGNLVSIRGDDTYPIGNTGLVANGFRSSNTYEVKMLKMDLNTRIQLVSKLLGL